SDGDVMPPHFFPKGLRQDSEGYVALIRDVGPWIKKVAAGRPYLAQNSEVAVREPGRLHEPNIWPPNSPDCNLCDFYLWGAVERDTNRTACNTMAELKSRITLCFKKLPRTRSSARAQ
ncbi:Uncharacterized protein FKW44_024946, partial [Caligus rogercresseyi]